MNNNRGNNRRRSRGSSNRSQSGSQLNRIDSRARGNAPQMLDKYRKLAQDAQLNGDRVQAEYYLQFADHYFRVIADSRSPKEEYRGRSDQRDQDGGDDEGDFDRGNRNPYDDRFESRDAPDDSPERGEPADYELSENPFTRDNRAPRASSRDERRPRRSRDESRGADREPAPGDVMDSAMLPPAILPPAINVAADSTERSPDESEAEVAKPRRRTRRTKAEGGETLEKIS